MPGVVQAYPNDNATTLSTIYGYSGRTGEASCTAGCHFGGSYTSSTPSITGSATVQTSSLNNAYTLTFTTNAPQAGFNLAAKRNADDAQQGGLGTADPDVQAVGTNELAHNAPTVASGGSVVWTFNWDAPATAGTYTFYVCANPVNGNRDTDEANGIGEDGDGPQLCGTKIITVNAQPVISAIANQAISEDGSTGALAFTISDAETATTAMTPTGSSSNTTLVPNGNITFTGSGTNRTVTVTPAANQNGSATITISLSDGDGGSDTEMFTVTVSAVNDAPSISGVANVAAYTENAAAVTVDSTVTISDIDSPNLNQATVSITANFASGQDVLVCPSPAITGISCAYDGATGVLTLSGTATLANYEQALEAVGYQNTSDNPSTATRTLSFVVRDDSNASSAADTTTLTVSAVNDAPVAVADASGIAKNSSGNTLDVLANDSDVEGNSLSITAVTTPSAGGSVSIQGSAPSQTLSYAPATNYSGTETFDYTISDGSLTSTVTVTITVSTGTAPVANADSPSAVTEDSSANVLDVLANDTDADVGDTLTVIQVNGSGTFPVATTNGSVSRSGSGPGNTLLYTPSANYAGADSFTYTVEDAAGLTSSATVTVTVSAVNDAPAISAPASIGVTEDVVSALTGITFSDVDAASGSLTATFAVASGTLSATSGGGVTVGGTTTARTLSGTIANLNSFISGSGLGFTTASNANTTVAMTVDLADGGNTGSGGAQSATQAAVSLTVTAVNDAPTITSTAVTAATDGQPYTYTLAVSDPDDTSFSFLIVSGEPAGMTLGASTGVLSWTPPCATSLSGYSAGPITVSAADGGENGVSPATQTFTITVAAPDSDGDGMPNCYELARSFDPNNAADGAQDRDGDGRSNADEFAAGTDPDVDDVLPVVTAPADLVVPATGYLTAVDLGTASASDTLTGTLEATVDNAGPFRPGRYTLTWTAQDEAGNVGTDTQLLDVLPLASFNVDQVAGEGATANVTVTLNGDPPQYPVTIGYTVSGTAGAADSDAAAGSFTLNSPALSATVPVAVAADGVPEGAETVVFTLGAADQATPGPRATHTITISEANEAPQVSLTAAQGAYPRQFAYQGDGVMTVTATASDPNGDPLSYDWSGSDDALGIDSDAGAAASFDASSLSAGSYVVRVSVSDTASATGSALLLVRVVAGTSTAEDLDADGILDAADSVLDYAAVLDNQAGNSATVELLETEPGLSLRKGRTALAAGRSGALVAMSDLVTFGVGEGGLALGADSYENIGGLFDFEIHGLAPGGSARVVVPLQTAIRAGAVYRKFDPASGWHDFVEDADNALASAFSTLGQCPGPVSTDYSDGLQPFADCVRLTLNDGGPNDADGLADGVIRDPGGVADAATSAPRWAGVDGGAWSALALLLAPLLRRRPRLALGFLLCLVAGPAIAEHHIAVSYGGELGAGYDGNVGNAELERDTRESSVVNGALHATYSQDLGLTSMLVLRGSLGGEYYRSFEKLSNGKATGMARLMYRANGEFFTPVLAAWVSAAYWEFGSALRDSDEYRAGVFLNQQLSTRLSGRLALGGVLRESESRVFDTRGASAALSLDWQPASGRTVYTGYQFYRGDVVSTATTPGAFKIVQAAEAIEADDAFGGFATRQNAYRLDADAHVGTLGYNHAFSPRLSADLQGQYIDTRADQDNAYQRVIGVLSLLARF